MEDPKGKRGGGHDAFIRHISSPGLHDVGMRPIGADLFSPQHDMDVLGAEELQQPAAFVFAMAPGLIKEAVQFILIQIIHRQEGSCIE